MADATKDDMATSGQAHAAANANLRETAKWMVVGTFAALGVVLAGTSFSSVGALLPPLPRDLRLILAVIGGLAGLWGLVRMTYDALGVLTFEQFSLAQYAFGELDSGTSWLPLPSSAPAGQAPARKTALVRLTRRFSNPAGEDLIAELRDRINRQFRADWPAGIENFEEFTRLSLAAEELRTETELTGDVAQFVIDHGKLVVSCGGQRIAPEGAPPFHVALKQGKLVVSGRAQLIPFDIPRTGPNAGKPRLAGGKFTISRDDLDYFAQATYNAAMFNKVSLSFERMQRRTPASVMAIAVGFVVMIAMFNPPKPPASSPEQREVTRIEYDQNGREVQRIVTTAPVTPAPAPR